MDGKSGISLLPRSLAPTAGNRTDRSLTEKRAGEKQWFAHLERWRQSLGTEDRDEVGRISETIRNPAAVPALTHLLRCEPVRTVKLLYINMLALIDQRAGKWQGLCLFYVGVRA